MRLQKKKHVRDLSSQLKKRSITHVNAMNKRKIRSDAIKPEVKTIVVEFYYSRGRPLPNKRYTTKWGPAYVLQSTLRTAYTEFRGQYPEIKISFSTFYYLRPRNIRLLSKSHWEYCVCTVCQNIKYKIESLNSSLIKANIPRAKISKIEDVILCPKGDNARFHSAECVYKTCVNCSDYNASIKEHYQDILKLEPLPQIMWHHWERVEEQGKLRKKLVTKKESVTKAVDELVKDVEEPVKNIPFPKHLFVGGWQQQQFLSLKQNLTEDEVLMVLDFGKNRAIHHQDQAKCDYYNARQVTIHPVVMYYRSPTVCGLTVRDAMIMVSDDLKHDHFAVTRFLKESLDYIRKINLPATNICIFSDGCAAQYKGRATMAALSINPLRITWNFFGSDHGKGEADGELGVLNRSLDKAILGRKVIISNANDICQWSNIPGNMYLDEPGSKRHFHHIIDIDRSGEATNVKSLNGIRSLHQIRNTSEDYILEGRRLTCFCPYCKGTDKKRPCINQEYVGEYIEQKLTPILQKKDTNVMVPTEDIEVSIIEVPADSTYTIEYQLAPVTERSHGNF